MQDHYEFERVKSFFFFLPFFSLQAFIKIKQILKSQSFGISTLYITSWQNISFELAKDKKDTREAAKFLQESTLYGKYCAPIEISLPRSRSASGSGYYLLTLTESFINVKWKTQPRNFEENLKGLEIKVLFVNGT